MADIEKKKAAAAEAKTAAPKKAAKPLPKSAGKASPKAASARTAASKPDAKVPAAEADKPKGKAAKAVKGDTLTVVQTGSSTRRPADQHATLVGLGLGRIGKRRLLADTASVRGMIDKVAHLVRVEDAVSAGEK